MDQIGDIIGFDINDVDFPGIPDFDFSSPSEKSDIFDSRRKGWHEANKIEPRCDFAPNRHAIKHKNNFWIHTLWARSPKGRTLSDIKADSSMADFIGNHMAIFIAQMLAGNLDPKLWSIIVPPPRRHLQRNFATAAAEIIADNLGINFEPGILKARNRQRINAEFQLVKQPEAPNLILFDDIITTGSTFIACLQALRNLNKSILIFAAINNG